MDDIVKSVKFAHKAREAKPTYKDAPANNEVGKLKSLDHKEDTILEEEILPKEKEIGGTPGLDPTRYGDWQHKGKVTDF